MTYLLLLVALHSMSPLGRQHIPDITQGIGFFPNLTYPQHPVSTFSIVRTFESTRVVASFLVAIGLYILE